jgi:hypothetical protein
MGSVYAAQFMVSQAEVTLVADETNKAISETIWSRSRPLKQSKRLILKPPALMLTHKFAPVIESAVIYFARFWTNQIVE